MKSLLTFIKGESTACGRRFADNEKGGTIAELAILIPFLIIMIAAVSELGRLFQAYTNLSKSTRAAARYLSNVSYDDEQIARAKNVEGDVGNPTSVTITITNYNFQPLFNLGALLQADSFTNLPIGSSTTMYYMWVDPAGAEE
jgi:Flp pilus assembly protein TadG